MGNLAELAGVNPITPFEDPTRVKPAPFQYHAPRAKAEALQLLASQPDARVLAGGQSLVPMLNILLATPGHVIDVNRIAELLGIAEANSVMRVDAMTRQCDTLESSAARRSIPLLHDALSHVRHPQTRSRNTLSAA